MPKKLKFSIVTPSFNQSATLSQTIDSVVNQKYSEYEYFIYDSISTDDSQVIIKKYAKKYKQIKAQIKKDNGQPDALNQAFAKASGDIYAFINSDDYYLSSAFKQVAKYFSDHPECQWLVGNCLTDPKSYSWSFWLKELIPYDQFPTLLYIFNFINQPAVFIRKELFQTVGQFDTTLNYCFDYDFWLRLIKITHPHRLQVSLSVFRISDTSKGSTAYHQQFMEDYLVARRYISSNVLRTIHLLLAKLVVQIYKVIK